jgi:serine/threonine-protein kinase
MRAGEVTIASGSEIEARVQRERAPIGVVGATGSHAVTGTVSLLRQRLRFFNALQAVVWTLVLLGADTPFILSARGAVAPIAWVLAAEHALVVIVAGALVYVLGPRSTHTTRQLRWLELVTLAPPVLTFATDQFWNMLNHPLIDAWNAVQSTYASGWSSYWLLLIILHSVLVPNSWRRCAAIATTIGLIPLAITVLVEAWQGWPTPAVPLTMFLTVMTLTLAAAIPAIVYNVHRHELLRNEVQEARQFGQYRLGRRLGAGGMGEVYMAEHMLLRRPCAIKLIRPECAGDPKNLIRFEREVQATATLTHPNTIQVFDYGRTNDGTFYYVMEYLPGLTFDELVQKHGPLPPARAIFLLRQMCQALGEAHGIGLIHRDIKPGNVIACERGGVPDVAKLLDFGLVRGPRGGLAEGVTLEGAIAGTPAYMSPEQAAGRGGDERSDIYSVGALAYFLLTGRPPFAHRSPVEILAAHLRDRPDPLSVHRPDVPDELQAIVLRCLEKNPLQRFPDARSLEQALRGCPCAHQWTEEQATDWWRRQPSADAKNGLARTDSSDVSGPTLTLTASAAPRRRVTVD